jgi:hypothetical protein
MIRRTLLVPDKLRMCMEGVESGKNYLHENLARRLERFTDRITGVEADKQRSIELYAVGELTKDVYIAENRTLDQELQRLHKRKLPIAKELETAAANDMVESSIKEYCELAKARFEHCNTFDATREFLLDHIQRIVYNRSKVIILGNVPVRRGTLQVRRSCAVSDRGRARPEGNTRKTSYSSDG